MLPRVTDSELVQDPTRFVAPHRYSPASVDAMLGMDSDGLLTVPPEYLTLFEMSILYPFNNQYTVNAGGPCETLAIQWMVTEVSLSVIVPGNTTVGNAKT